MFNRKNRANGKNSREFNRCMIESRDRRVCGDSNGDRKCIGSGNMAWVITAMKNVVTIYKWTFSYILYILTRNGNNVPMNERIYIPRNIVKILHHRSQTMDYNEFVRLEFLTPPFYLMNTAIVLTNLFNRITIT